MYEGMTKMVSRRPSMRVLVDVDAEVDVEAVLGMSTHADAGGLGVGDGAVRGDEVVND